MLYALGFEAQLFRFARVPTSPGRVCHLDSEPKVRPPVISTVAEGGMERSVQNRFLRFAMLRIAPVEMTGSAIRVDESPEFGAEQVRLGPSAAPQVVFRIGVLVEEPIELRAEFLLHIGLFRLAVQIEPLVGIVFQIV